MQLIHLSNSRADELKSTIGEEDIRFELGLETKQSWLTQWIDSEIFGQLNI
jgi:hypothetical protein